jgi:hypothetical protein
MNNIQSVMRTDFDKAQPVMNGSVNHVNQELNKNHTGDQDNLNQKLNDLMNHFKAYSNSEDQ